MVDFLIYAGLAIGGVSFFLLFVLPALPILWWRAVNGVANLIQAVAVLSVVLPLVIAIGFVLVIAAGMLPF